MWREIVALLVVAITSFYLGYRAGIETSGIDLGTFDAQARVIRELAHKLADARGETIDLDE